MTVSFVVHCENQEEVDRYWTRLAEGGNEIQCGWLKDKFGLAWQIVPEALLEMIQGPDRAKANRIMKSMMKMIKLDLAELEKAYRSE